MALLAVKHPSQGLHPLHSLCGGWYAVTEVLCPLSNVFG